MKSQLWIYRIEKYSTRIILAVMLVAAISCSSNKALDAQSSNSSNSSGTTFSLPSSTSTATTTAPTAVGNLFDFSTASDPQPTTTTTISSTNLNTTQQNCLNQDSGLATGSSCIEPSTTMNPDMNSNYFFGMGMNTMGKMSQCHQWVAAYDPSKGLIGGTIESHFQAAQMALVRCFRNISQQNTSQQTYWSQGQNELYQQTDSGLYQLLQMFSQGY